MTVLDAIAAQLRREVRRSSARRPPSARTLADAELTTTIRRIHADSPETYGAPRVLAELRLGLGLHVARKRVAPLMRIDGLVGVSHGRKRRGWRPDTATHEDLVKRQFRADARTGSGSATSLNTGRGTGGSTARP